MFDLNIFFYWDGPISDSRLKILKDSVYSTRVFNPNHHILIVSNSLTEDMFDPKFRINIMKWDLSLFEDTPVPVDVVEKYYLNAHPREVSDLIRLVLLYKFGGSYIDTDDLAIKPISSVKNLICRSYDPHTCHYNNLQPEDCIPGKYRELRGYDEINMFPRNDCWLNFQPYHHIIKEILSHPKFLNAEKAVYIGDDFSWQSLTLDVIKNNIQNIRVTFDIGLTLLYLYEDFVSASSYWDRCMHGGEMCDFYKTLPNLDKYEWGSYRCTKDVASNFYDLIKLKYPVVSHMWLHSKDMKEEWMLPQLTDKYYSLSTWIYELVKEKINEWR
jgi:hypothetical protein